MSSLADTGAVRFRALLPHPEPEVDLATAYAYPAVLDRPWLRANMVASADGGAWGRTGHSGDLSSAGDRRAMSVLRGLCDVVLAGAGTARIEGYRPVRAREVWGQLRAGRSATPPIAVVSRTLDLNPSLLSQAPEDARTIVLTTESAPQERRRHAAQEADVVVAGEDAVQPQLIMSALAERGLLRVLTEGGPHLLAELTSAGLLDELCLTVSPHLAGPEPARIVTGDAPSRTQDMELAHVLESEGTLFLRYTRAREN